MTEKNEATNENQDENQHGNGMNESGLEVTNTEPPADVDSSNPLTEKASAKLNAPLSDERSSHAATGSQVSQGPSGPRTLAGKKRSSRNSIKYGFFSKVALLNGESRSELQLLRDVLRKTLAPADDLEEILFDNIVMDFWRIRRVHAAEAAEYRKIFEFVDFDRCRMEQQEAERVFSSRQSSEVDPLTFERIPLIGYIHNSKILDRCLQLLVYLQRSIKTKGVDRKSDERILRMIYGDPEKEHFQWTLLDEYINYSTEDAGKEKYEQEGYPAQEKSRQQLRAIRLEINRLKALQYEFELVETKRRKSEILRQVVPESPMLDRLLRYRTSAERMLERHLSEYERAQAKRRGQHILPPLKVELDVSS